MSPYRKLLEGEESRYSTLSDAQIPVPYVYRQSPIYTLPSVPRVGGLTRKPEPQYKFVEEIITETTREDIEVSDTGSDDDEQREGDTVCSEKENASVAEEKKMQESDAEDNTGSPEAEQLDNKEKTAETEEQALKKSSDASVDLEGGGTNAELAQNNLIASEQTGENIADMDNYSNNKVDDTVSKTQEPDSETKTEKPDAGISGDKDVEKVTLNNEKGKQDIAKEIDQASIKESKPAAQTAAQEAITEKGKSAVEEISPKSETQPVAKVEDSSTGKAKAQDRETSEVKSVEVDASTADPQPVSQKAEAGQDTHLNSEADSKPRVDTSQADILDTTKAVSVQDNAAEVQKELVDKVKTEAPLKSEGKEIKSEEEKKVDKSEAEREIVKPENEDSVQARKEPETQEDVAKTDAKEPETETSETKGIHSKDMKDSAKSGQSTELKKTEKENDQMQVKEQPKVAEMETKSEEKSHKAAGGTKEDQVDNLKTEEKIPPKSSEIQKEDIQKEPKPTEKETKYEPKSEKQASKETSEDIQKMDIIKPEGQEIDGKPSKDVQPEQSVQKSSPEKEQSKDQANKDTDSSEIKDMKIEKSDKTDSTEVKQDSTKMDTTKSKDLEKDPTPMKESKRLDPTEKGQVLSEKGQDNGTKADLNKERDVPAVTENGVNI